MGNRERERERERALLLQCFIVRLSNHNKTYLAKGVHALLDIGQLDRALVDANLDGIVNDTFDTDKDLHIVIK
jgi:hypothetical protein